MRKLAALAFALSSLALFAERDMAIYRGKLTSDLNANGKRITSVGSPLNPGDAANKEYVDSHGGGCDTNAVDALANSAVVTNALTVATTNRVAALETHVENTNNPHKVTAEQIGAVPFVEDVNSNKTAVTIGSRIHGEEIGEHSLANGIDVLASGYYSHAEGNGTTASGNSSHAEGDGTTASGYYSHAEGNGTTASGICSHAEGNGTTASGYSSHAEGDGTTASGFYSHAGGYLSQTKADDIYAFAWNGDYWKTEEDPYKSNGPGTFNINPLGGLNGFYIGEQTLHAILTNKADKADISATNPTFSNAVLAVNVDFATNTTGAAYVAVTNALAGFGFDADALAELPSGKVYGSIGALLAALAAAVAWLKKKALIGGLTGGVPDDPKVHDFFTESNGLLTGTIDDRLPIPISEKSEGFTTESYKRFVVTVSGDMTVTLHTPTSGDAEIFECRFNGTSLAADASITFAGATATTMDTDCGTVTAGKVALMSAFWNGTTWDVNWKVEG